MLALSSRTTTKKPLLVWWPKKKMGKSYSIYEIYEFFVYYYLMPRTVYWKFGEKRIKIFTYTFFNSLSGYLESSHNTKILTNLGGHILSLYFILKKGTKYVRQDLSKVFVLWLDSSTYWDSARQSFFVIQQFIIKGLPSHRRRIKNFISS